MVLLGAISMTVYSQNSTHPVSIALYSNFNLNSNYITHGQGPSEGTIHTEFEREFYGFNFSPAVEINTDKGNYHSVEISRLAYNNNYNKEYYIVDSTGAISQVLSASTAQAFNCFLRYEYTITLFKKQNWEKFGTAIGFSATPFFRWSKSNSSISSEFPVTKTGTGIYLSVIPRLTYSFSEKWFIDLNVPLALVTAQYNSIKTDNPVLPVNQRNTATFDFHQGPIGVAVRLGVGYRFR